jgi:RIP homotypic interaction motif
VSLGRRLLRRVFTSQHAEQVREAGVVGSGSHVTITGSQGVQVGSGNTQTDTFQAPPA